MAVVEKKSDGLANIAKSFIAGAAYGLTSLVIGQPLDNIKTRMQAMSGFQQGSALQCAMKTFNSEGILGFYRGSIPPLIGSVILRSLQFGSMEIATHFMKSNNLLEDSKFLFVDSRIWVGGMFAGAARAVVEAPLEVAKVRRQVGQSWQVRDLTQGFGVTLLRNSVLLSTFFVFADVSRRNLDIDPRYRPLFVGAICATGAWLVSFPLDVVKSQIQAANKADKRGIVSTFKSVLQERGFFGLYRGIGPGMVRSVVANGISMLVFDRVNKYLTTSGLF